MNRLSIRLFDTADFVSEMQFLRESIRDKIVRVESLIRSAGNFDHLVIVAGFIGPHGDHHYVEIKVCGQKLTVEQVDHDSATEIKRKLLASIERLNLIYRPGRFEVKDK